MKRQEFRRRFNKKIKEDLKGEITVFLSLLLVVLLTFIGAMVQSASIHITKSMKRADTKLALESVFAEYEGKLLDEYDVFAKLDGDETKFSRRLWFYGAKDMEHKIQKIQFLTDNKGQAFYEQAIHSMGGEVKKVEEITEIPWEEKEQQVNLQLEELLSKTEATLPKEENPLEWIKHLRQSSLLTLVLQNPEKLSNRYVTLVELPSHRNLAQGTGGFGEVSKNGVTQRALFTAYLAEHFPHYLKNKEENSLFYEAEYLLCGKESDRENLEAVFRKILTIRTGVNYAYLLTDQTKLAEAGGMAATLSVLLMIPEATELVKQALLFSWSCGESMLELRTLAEGKKIPIIKTAETWQLDLDSLLKVGTEEDASTSLGDLGTSLEDKKGMGYEDFITMFFVAENTDNLCMRALDLMELKLGIRMDGCVTAVEIKSTVEMQRGIRDTFLSQYQYR